jgi:uncharacterized protein (TIGR03118 family)
MRTRRVSVRHRSFSVSVLATAVLVVAVLATAAPAASDNKYTVMNLVSDQPDVAAVQDTHLVNAWGLDAFSGSPWWTANNETGTSSLFRADGSSPRPPVNVPGHPTGLVANIANVNGSFEVGISTPTAPALFLFSTEEGKIYGWNPTVARNDAFDTHAETPPGAIYKGLAIASTSDGDFLYATDFHNGHVDVFDDTFHQAALPAGAFTDPSLPSSYAPFGIQNVGGSIVVTYAKQDKVRASSISTRRRERWSPASPSTDS